MSEAPRVSLVVNTLNAAQFLEGCLESARGAVDEIVVVDMQSDDGTADLARKFTPHVFTHERMGYVEPARNFAADRAGGDWLLVLDADERLTPALAAGLRPLVADPAGVDVFLVPFNTLVAGRWMLGTGWGRDSERHPRLHRRGALTWNEQIHRPPTVHGRLAHLPLGPDAAIDHHNYRDLADFVERLNRYTSQEARDLAAAGAHWTPEGMFEAARAEALKRYEPGADGAHSLVLAGLMGFYRYLAWAKLWELEGRPQSLLPDGPGALAKWLADPEGVRAGWLSDAGIEAGMARAAEVAALPPKGEAGVGCGSGPRAERERFGDAELEGGFHGDEGGWRWMTREGRLWIPAEELTRDRVLSLELSGGPPGCYARAPFELRVYVGGGLVGALSVPGSDSVVRGELRLPRCGTGIRVRIASDEVFRPADRGMGEDRRELSVRLTRAALG